MHPSARPVVLLVLALTVAPTPAADTLYRWLDDQGRPHFSDRPPPDDAQAPESIELPAFAEPASSPEDDPYSILNQARRLDESRRELERQREEAQRRAREYELRRREIEALRSPPQPPAASTTVYAYPRPLPPRPPLHPPSWRPPQTRPPSLWEPDHPAYRPYPGPWRR